MLLYALTIFASAFLLFLLQPIAAKEILPWFGGSAAVWTTCLVFFQSALLAGYAYSDRTTHRLAPRRQVMLHSILLVASIAVLPIIPGAQWKPHGDENPAWLILALLTAVVGLPYFLLSTTSPLVQAWFARAEPGRSPYRLFALSNLASMLALLGYPLVLEPWAPTRVQAWGWSIAYVAFVLLCIATGWRALARGEPRASDIAAASALAREASATRPTLRDQALWLTLSATGSLLLLGVSNHITQNVAAVPLLWILPLALYLLTFILTFDSSWWYRRPLVPAIVAVALGEMAWTLADARLTHMLGLQLAVFCIGLFLACLFCHGELARSKPAPAYLTRFYLMISIGGAMGAVLVGILAPLVLPAYFELPAGLVLCGVLLVLQVRREHVVFRALGGLAVLVAFGGLVWNVHKFYESTIVAARNFYGVLRVLETAGQSPYRSLVHGTILHGLQYQAPELKRRPSTYYTESSGIGRVLQELHPTLTPLTVGVIGLGTGTLAAWGAKGDVYRFYDINPAVPIIAQREFTYLKDSDATIQISLGDARLELEREAPQGFDVLAIDAFSSDAIPVHLITREALDVYLRHVKPTGIIAFHVTNRFLNLVPVLEALVHERGLQAVHIADDGDNTMAYRSDWVLIARDGRLLERPGIADAATELEVRRDWRVWTDDYNNLVQVLK